MNELSPFLAEQKRKEEGFKVPVDYFQSLPDEVLRRIGPMSPEPSLQPESNWLDQLTAFVEGLFQPRYALAYATTLALLVAVVYLISGPADGTAVTAEVKLEQISGEAIESYLAENIEFLGTDLLEENFAAGDTEITTDLELEEMEDYLDDELDDLSIDDLEELL